MTCAALMKQYRGAHYWKPVQTGDDRDAEVVRRLSQREEKFFHPGLTFGEPLSPHRAAELDEKEISLEGLDEDLHRVIRTVESGSSAKDGLPGTPIQTRDSASVSGNPNMLFIEGAGGLMVPLNRKQLWPDWLVGKSLSLILVCRTGLGTINHSLLSIEAIRRRNLKLAGLVFFGPENPDNQRTIADFSEAPILGQFSLPSGSGESDLPLPEKLDAEGLLLKGVGRDFD